MMVRVYDRDMAQIDSMPYYDYTDTRNRNDTEGAWSVRTPNGGLMLVGIPFYAREQRVIDPTGQMWTTARGITTLRVSRWVPAGDTTLVLESGRRPAPVTAARRDSVMAELEESFSSWPSPPRYDAGDVPATEPPAFGLSLDDRGRLWVRLSHPDADTTAYDVFGRDGRHAETVVFHDRVDGDIPPVTVGDTVWVVVRDDLDVQSIVRAVMHRTGQI